jgi:hypothetical protein
MSDTIIVALLSLAGTFIGSFSGIKLITYRIQQLESKVEKHNQVIERVYKLEKHEAVVDEKIEHLEAYHN